MERIVRNIELAEFAAELCSVAVLFLAESIVLLLCARIGSRLIRFSCIVLATVGCVALYTVALERLAWALVLRVAIVEGLDFGWFQYWLLPAITITAAFYVRRRFRQVVTASPN